MGNEFRGCLEHSAEYFGDSREYWWNTDYLAFVASQWHLDAVDKVLDVGCGVGHWGRLLATVLRPDALVVGIDREPLWTEKATEFAAAARLSDRFCYQQGDVGDLPFPDNSFDLVTCQTLLMHLAEPAKALAEMVRVARPGGTVLVSEPNNVLGPIIADAVGLGGWLEVDDGPLRIARCVEFQLVCQRGRRLLGEGDDLIGERLPKLLADAGLAEIQIRLNDKASPLVPPYDQPEQQVMVEETIDFVERGRWVWPREATLRYFLAGGGTEPEFAALWEGMFELRRRTVRALRDKTGSCAGGNLAYLAWGWKPESS